MTPRLRDRKTSLQVPPLPSSPRSIGQSLKYLVTGSNEKDRMMYDIRDIDTIRCSHRLNTEVEALDQRVCEALDEITILEMVRKRPLYVAVPHDDEVVNAELNRQIVAKSEEIEALMAQLEILERARLIVNEQLSYDPTTENLSPSLT